MTGEAEHSQRLETLGLLAAGVVHDVNNLLTVIANYASLALEPGVDAPPPDEAGWRRLLVDIEQIHRAAQRGSDLAVRLLTFARPGSGETATVGVNAVVEDALVMLRGAMGSDIAVSVVLEPACWQVSTDPVRLGQAVVNLIVNARDAMPEGGTLTVRTANAVLAAEAGRPEGRYVRVEVADSGAGIPPELLNRVFEPFFSTKPAGAGTGLGLAMVREYVTHAGGTVGVRSWPGEGTRFELLLPVASHA